MWAAIVAACVVGAAPEVKPEVKPEQKEENPSKLRVKVVPSKIKANVYLGSEFLGVTGEVIEVPAGTHGITVEREGCWDANFDYVSKPGRSSSKTIRMIPGISTRMGRMDISQSFDALRHGNWRRVDERPIEITDDGRYVVGGKMRLPGRNTTLYYIGNLPISFIMRIEYRITGRWLKQASTMMTARNFPVTTGKWHTLVVATDGYCGWSRCNWLRAVPVGTNLLNEGNIRVFRFSYQENARGAIELRNFDIFECTDEQFQRASASSGFKIPPRRAKREERR